MVNNKIANDIAGLQASRLNNVIDPNPQYTDTSFSKEVTELFDPSCLAYLDSEGKLCVDSVTVSSEIIFNYPFTELMEKGVEEIRIQFTVEGEGNPVFAGFGLGSPTVKDFKSYEIVINDTVNVDETISTLSFSKEDVAYYMKTGLFRLYLVFLQGNSVCNVKLSNVIVTFTYTNNIVNEVKVIENRLEALGITGGDYDDLTDKPTIPSKISDLTNDSDFIEKSTTSGLVKNDGTIDTTSYSTFDGDYNNLSNKPTIPSASSTTPSADTSSGSYGSGTSYARSNHTHPKSSLYAAATHNHTKSQITDFPTIPSKTSQLTNDSGFLTSHQSLSNYYNKSETNNYDVDFILGTQTASTSAWTGTTDVISSLREGTTIFYKLPYASTSTSVTLNLTLKGGETTGAKNVFYKNTTRVTTHFGVGQVVGLVYNGTAWYVISPSDNNSNNDNNYGGIQFKAGEALTTQTICCAKDNGQYYKVANGVVLDIRYPLIMTSSAVASGTTTNTMYRTWYGVNIANTKSMTLTNGSQLFLEGTAYSNGKFTISSNVVTHTLTNGRYYIKVGTALSTTQIRFISDMTVYYYNGTTLKPVIKKDQIVDFPTIPTKTSDLTNDGDGTNAFLTQHQSLGNYVQKSSTRGLLKNDGSVDTTQYLSSLPSHNHDDRYYTESEVDTALNGKQATLISGTNIKTINNTSLLGSGNISIQGGGTVTVDDSLSTTSINPVQNKVITGALNGKANSSHTHLSSDVTDLIDVIYPVGSIYMSVNSVNPATLFGGKWEQIQDKFLLASGSTYSNGATGGSANAVVVSHTHTQNQHRHELTGSKTTGMSSGNYLRAGYGSATDRQYTNYSTPTINSTGEDGTGKNMPPYLVVNVWKRTA